MKTNLLTHVVPTLPPKTGDAGGYALDLARQLRDQYGINSQFILCNPNWDGPARIEDFVVRRLRFPNEAGLWGLLASIKDKPTVLLHYDAYGYHKHGLPIWLYQGINSWLSERDRKSGQSDKQFSTVFHDLCELSAKPWPGKFYLKMLQKRLVERLHRRSQTSITSSHRLQTLLDAMEPLKTLLLPVPARLPIIDRPLSQVGRELGLIAAASHTAHQQCADWKVIAQEYYETLYHQVPPVLARVEVPEELRMKIPLWSLPAPAGRLKPSQL
jgi:hypothetical protein